MHAHLPSRFDHGFPHLWQDDLSAEIAARAYQVIVTFIDMRSQDIDVQECLFDKFFDALR